MQEEKDKVQAQKEEVLSHMNDVLENELQCIICSEYFIEVSMSASSPHPVHQPLAPRNPSSVPQLSLNCSESLGATEPEGWKYWE